MKKLIIFSAAAMLSFTTSPIGGCHCKKANAATSSSMQIVSFYNVPLVCGAAPEIGCGSRAKPVLLKWKKTLLSKKFGLIVQEWFMQSYGTGKPKRKKLQNPFLINIKLTSQN